MTQSLFGSTFNETSLATCYNRLILAFAEGTPSY